MNNFKIPNGIKFVKDVELLYKDFEDLKKILQILPQNILTIENTTKLEEAIQPIKTDAILFLKSLEDKQRRFDIFKGGGESKGLCRILGISEDNLYTCIRYLKEIVEFDIKDFVINKKT